MKLMESVKATMGLSTLSHRLFLSFIAFTADNLCAPNKIAYPCISPTRLLHSTHEQLDGVPVISG